MPVINDIGIPLPASSGMGILQPKLRNRWMVQFIGVGGSATSSRGMSMQCVQASRPKPQFAEVELHRYNTVTWVAGKHTYDPITLTIQDDYSNTATTAIRDQIEKQQRIIGAEGGTYLAAAPDGATYKFAMKRDMLDGGDSILEEWNLEGCWIVSADYGEVS